MIIEETAVGILVFLSVPMTSYIHFKSAFYFVFDIVWNTKQIKWNDILIYMFFFYVSITSFTSKNNFEITGENSTKTKCYFENCNVSGCN